MPKKRGYQPKIDWKKLTGRHTVKLVKAPDPVRKGKTISHYETGSGKLILWSGREARSAQHFLDMKSRQRKRKK